MPADCPVCLNKTARIEQLEDRNTALHNEVVELRETLKAAVELARDTAGTRDRALGLLTGVRVERNELIGRNAKLVKLAAEAKLGTVAVAQRAERQVVGLEVVGSGPTGHPTSPDPQGIGTLCLKCQEWGKPKEDTDGNLQCPKCGAWYEGE